jgi:hypothetical protein
MSARGNAGGLEHGTPEGARQHTSRGVLPVCGPCTAALAAEREGDARTANAGLSPRFNAGAIGKTPQKRASREAKGAPAARQVVTSRPLTPWERRRTVRLLASIATGAPDLVLLLEAVDLTAQDGKAEVSVLTTTSSARGGR